MSLSRLFDWLLVIVIGTGFLVLLAWLEKPIAV